MDSERANPSGSALSNSLGTGIRREPELPEYEDIVPEASMPLPEFDFAEDGDGDAIRARGQRRNVSSLARQAAMDPDDGLEL